MISEHIEERQGVYYIPGTSISLDSVVYAFRERVFARDHPRGLRRADSGACLWGYRFLSGSSD
jgi:hypothetical protein